MDSHSSPNVSLKNEDNRLLRIFGASDGFLSNTERMLWNMNQIAGKLMSCGETGPFDEIVLDSLRSIGEMMGQDSSYIYKDVLDGNGEPACAKIFEWMREENAARSFAGEDYIVYSSLSRINQTLDENRCLNDFPGNLSRPETELMEKTGIKAVLLAPIVIDDKRWGFIGVDNCKESVLFSELEENALSIGGFLLANAIQKRINYAKDKKTETELRAARDEALNSLRTKSEFLAKMSHEIRTPMNAIVGMSELILREYLNPAVREYASTIKQASMNLLSIINDILDLSKIESGGLELIKEKYKLPSLINDVVNIISIRLTDKPIVLSAAIDSILPDELIGDEVRVRQILLNILSNAVKYTEKGSVTLEMYSEFVDKQKLNLIIDVADTGIGIKEENLKNLFGDYAKFDIARNKGVEGTGLGLAITRSLCEAMGGSISVRSVYGEGSDFRVVLPQEFQDYREIALLNEPRKHSVLVYETRETYAKPMQFAFDNMGVRYAMTADSSEFFEAMTEDVYSYIFLPSFLYEKSRSVINNAADRPGAPRIVVMTDYGEAFSEWGVITVSQPVYSVIIANILNGDSRRGAYDKPSVNIHFTAPNAKVLIVDDINTNLKVAKGLMTPFNMSIETCESGIEAIESVKSTHYDIVFMDHMMPEMDGIEATKKIREISSRKDLPIVALTANAISGVKEMFLSNGFSDFLAKPIEMLKLCEVLDKWIPDEKKASCASPPGAEAGRKISIEGIDVRAGLAMTGGDYNNYIDILVFFQKDGEKKISEIEASLSSSDMKLYATHVHALKSALASIGAEELSRLAKALEFAAKNRNTGFIEGNNDKFLHELNRLLKRIDEAVRAESADAEDEARENTIQIDSITPELLSLREALDNIDGEKMNGIIGILKPKCKGSEFEDKIDILERHILMCEYDEAIDYIDSTTRGAAPGPG